MAVMTVSEARAALPEVLNRVAEGEEITITRHGQAVAVIVRPDIMWSRSRAEDALAEADQLRTLMRAAPTGTSFESSIVTLPRNSRTAASRAHASENWCGPPAPYMRPIAAQ